MVYKDTADLAIACIRKPIMVKIITRGTTSPLNNTTNCWKNKRVYVRFAIYHLNWPYP
jgi:hypothetical protein